MMLEVAQTDNFQKIINAYRKVADANYSEDEQLQDISGYLRILFGISRTDTPQTVDIGAQKVRPIIQLFYSEMRFNLAPTDTIPPEAEARLLAFLIHSCFRKLSPNAPEENIEVIEVLESFFQTLATETFNPPLFSHAPAADAHSPTWSSLNELHAKVSKLGFMIIKEDALSKNAENEKLNKVIVRLQNELQRAKENKEIDAARQLTSSNPNKHKGTPVGRVIAGTVSILKTRMLNEVTQETALGALGKKYPTDADAFNVEACKISNLCRNLQTVISFLNVCGEDHIREAQLTNSQAEEFKATCLYNWNLILGKDGDNTKKLSRVLNQNLCTPITNENPFTQLNDSLKVVIAVLDVALESLKSLMVTANLTHERKATEWIFYLYGCRNIYGVLLRAVCPVDDPIILEKYPFISKLSKLDNENASWPFIESEGEFAALLNQSLFPHYISIEIQHKKDGVHLPEKRNIYKEAIDDILELHKKYPPERLQAIARPR